MSEGLALQNSVTGGNKKRKRASEAGHDRGSPKRPAINSEVNHLDPAIAYGAEDFVHHLQSATHAINESVSHRVGQENQASPYGTTNGDPRANSFDMVQHNHQETPYDYNGYKNPESDTLTRGKPAVGTAEWHQNRKDCHKDGTLFLQTQINCQLNDRS